MPMKASDEPIVIETLGDHLDRGYSLTAHCRACHHARRLDLAALIDRLGRAAVVDAWSRFRCLACGSSAAGIILAPPDRGVIVQSSNVGPVGAGPTGGGKRRRRRG